jgi:hypothetical protein
VPAFGGPLKARDVVAQITEELRRRGSAPPKTFAPLMRMKRPEYETCEVGQRPRPGEPDRIRLDRSTASARWHVHQIRFRLPIHLRLLPHPLDVTQPTKRADAARGHSHLFGLLGRCGLMFADSKSRCRRNLADMESVLDATTYFDWIRR